MLDLSNVNVGCGGCGCGCGCIRVFKGNPYMLAYCSRMDDDPEFDAGPGPGPGPGPFLNCRFCFCHVCGIGFTGMELEVV